MAEFFAKRLDDYEEHMSVWEKSYRLVAEAVPDGFRIENIIDEDAAVIVCRKEEAD